MQRKRKEGPPVTITYMSQAKVNFLYMARNANTPQARKYWSQRAAREA